MSLKVRTDLGRDVSQGKETQLGIWSSLSLTRGQRKEVEEWRKSMFPPIHFFSAMTTPFLSIITELLFTFVGGLDYEFYYQTSHFFSLAGA